MTHSLRTVVTLIALAAAPALAQPPRGTVCSEEHPTGCDRLALQKTFHDASGVALETHPTDRMATGQLIEMLHVLGKTAPALDASASLTLALQRLNTDGVFIGPAGAPLATLTVYGPARDGERGILLWAETYTGQPDMSWPAIVHALLTQFQSHALKP